MNRILADVLKTLFCHLSNASHHLYPPNYKAIE
jgi:hypothetical protein